MTTLSPEPDVDPARRFGGIARLYGDAAIGRLQQSHVCVVGIGGVGSWVVEALARSGVGRLTLIDLDHVAESNLNRQAHALETTLGKAKVRAMAERIALINPLAQVVEVEEFIDPDNAAALLAPAQGFDFVVDAIDNVRAKAAMIVTCRAQGLPLITLGAAGGQSDPTRIQVDDLSRTIQDPLLSSLRSRLRKEHGYSRDPKRRFGVEAVFSTEPLRYPDLPACDTPRGPAGLACAGFGSSMAVTATFGLVAAARVLDVLTATPRESA